MNFIVERADATRGLLYDRGESVVPGGECAEYLEDAHILGTMPSISYLSPGLASVSVVPGRNFQLHLIGRPSSIISSRFPLRQRPTIHHQLDSLTMPSSSASD